jgi:hypothetical protein
MREAAITFLFALAFFALAVYAIKTGYAPPTGHYSGPAYGWDLSQQRWQ